MVATACIAPRCPIPACHPCRSTSRRPSVLLTGPVGVGKTAIAHLEAWALVPVPEAETGTHRRNDKRASGERVQKLAEGICATRKRNPPGGRKAETHNACATTRRRKELEYNATARWEIPAGRDARHGGGLIAHSSSPSSRHLRSTRVLMAGVMAMSCGHSRGKRSRCCVLRVASMPILCPYAK